MWRQVVGVAMLWVTFAALGGVTEASAARREQANARSAGLAEHQRLPYAAILMDDWAGLQRMRRNGQLSDIEHPYLYFDSYAALDGRQIAVVFFFDDWAREGGLFVYDRGKWEEWFESPDINSPTFLSRDAIVAELNGGIWLFTRPAGDSPSEPVLIFDSPYWPGAVTASPSGLIALVQWHPEDYQLHRIVLISFEGETLWELPWREAWISDLRFSPDGARLLYREWGWTAESGDWSDVCIAEVGSGEPGQLVKASAYSPAWLPDGGIAYVTAPDDPDIPGYLLWMEPAGGEPQFMNMYQGFVEAVFPY